MTAKLKALLAEYGGVAMGVYFAIFGLVFAGAFAALKFGVSFEGVAADVGTVAAAWVLTKITQPVRIIATVALTPVVAAVVRRRGPAPTEEPKEAEDNVG